MQVSEDDIGEKTTGEGSETSWFTIRYEFKPANFSGPGKTMTLFNQRWSSWSNQALAGCIDIERTLQARRVGTVIYHISHLLSRQCP
jgi:hypothetical protein